MSGQAEGERTTQSRRESQVDRETEQRRAGVERHSASNAAEESQYSPDLGVRVRGGSR